VCEEVEGLPLFFFCGIIILEAAESKNAEKCNLFTPVFLLPLYNSEFAMLNPREQSSPVATAASYESRTENKDCLQ
jgi:hypothetical protein